ncbi:MAG TPA: HK97 family phage prohead protease [Polyangiaceae bacterium]|nr:HK97 family phage prohead protease [Polyangiaceae bacterium]
MDTILKSHDLSFRAVNKETRRARFVASTDTVDRYGEVIEQKSWKLDAYRKNPIVLFNHNANGLFSGPETKLPIGRATDVAIVGGQLEVEVAFLSQAASPLAEQCWQQVVEGGLRAVSVGFIPHTLRSEKRNGTEVVVIADAELVECSLCMIPANPDCVRKSKAWGGPTGAPALLDVDCGRALAERIERAMQLERTPAAPPPVRLDSFGPTLADRIACAIECNVDIEPTEADEIAFIREQARKMDLDTARRQHAPRDTAGDALAARIEAQFGLLGDRGDDDQKDWR